MKGELSSLMTLFFSLQVGVTRTGWYAGEVIYTFTFASRFLFCCLVCWREGVITTSPSFSAFIHKVRIFGLLHDVFCVFIDGVSLCGQVNSLLWVDRSRGSTALPDTCSFFSTNVLSVNRVFDPTLHQHGNRLVHLVTDDPAGRSPGPLFCSRHDHSPAFCFSTVFTRAMSR